MRRKKEMINIKHILKEHAYQDIPLNYEEGYELGKYAIEGCYGNELAQIQSITALCALHNIATYNWKKNGVPYHHSNRLPENAAEQIAGICAAIFEQDIGRSEFGFVNPDVEYAMDNCGMGGDLITTPNVSTVAAFIAAGDGIPMCKHGSPANADKGKYGSSDFISLICGIDNYADKKVVEECVKQYNFGYTEACDTRYKRIHLQTHQIAQLPHMNDIIGPITNPLNSKIHTRRILGVNHLIPTNIVAKAYLILNDSGITKMEHGIFVRGFADSNRYEGMDEVSICVGGTQVSELKDRKISTYDLYAKDFGIMAVSVDNIQPKGNKGEFSLKILKGEINGPPLQMILANSAMLFYLARRSNDLKECYKMAEESLLNGKPYEIMLAIQEKIPHKK